MWVQIYPDRWYEGGFAFHRVRALRVIKKKVFPSLLRARAINEMLEINLFLSYSIFFLNTVTNENTFKHITFLNNSRN